jgi:hypothetical protein
VPGAGQNKDSIFGNPVAVSPGAWSDLTIPKSGWDRSEIIASYRLFRDFEKNGAGPPRAGFTLVGEGLQDRHEAKSGADGRAGRPAGES